MARWQGRLEHRQRFLGRLVDIGAELFAMSATCVRAQQTSHDNPGQGETECELADTFCVQASARVEELFDRLWANSDNTDTATARRVLDGRYRWLDDGIIDASIPGPWIAQHSTGHATGPDQHRIVNAHPGG